MRECKTFQHNVNNIYNSNKINMQSELSKGYVGIAGGFIDGPATLNVSGIGNMPIY